MPNTTAHWINVCDVEDIVPNTGVCALVNGKQVAVFRVNQAQDRIFAIGNHDPNSNASVLSRGLIGSIGERIVVASPIYKHHFDLETGHCLEEPDNSVPAWPTRVADGKVWVAA